MTHTQGAPMTEHRKKQIAWALVIAWAVAIFVISAKPADDFMLGVGVVAQLKMWLSAIVSSVVGHTVDVSPIGHFTEYLVFGALLANALRHHFPPAKAAILAVCIASAYAVTDEIHQIFVPGRESDPADFLVDTTAAAIAAGIAWLLMRRHAGPGPE